MKRPQALVYSADEKPPAAIVWLSGLQHVSVVAVFLVLPLAVCRAANASSEVARNVLAMTLLVGAVGTLLQTLRRGPLGCGYLAPNGATAIYLGPSMIAAQAGGLPLVFGMTIIGGIAEMLVAPLLHRLRSFVPPEIAGLVVLLIGISFSALGVRLMLGGAAGPIGAWGWAVAGLTLAVAIALNIWTRGAAKAMCAFLGLAAGYGVAVAAGIANGAELAAIGTLPWVDVPRFAHAGWAIDPALILPFAVAGVAVAINASASVTIFQRMHDADWVRPETGSIRRGALADGFANVIAGAFGGHGLTILAANVGLVVATQIAARRIAYAVAAIAAAFAFVPPLTALLVATPDAVVAGALFFAGAFVIASGMQIITSRMLDGRRTLTIGLALIAAIAVLMFPHAADAAPDWLRPIGASPLVLGIVVAFCLNLLFRIGVKKTVATTIDPGTDYGRRIDDFLAERGAAWGARPDVIRRAIFGATQAAESVIEHCEPRGPLALAASFDEFNLDLAIRYAGAALELPDTRPTDREIVATEEGARRLAGYMLRRNADKVQSGVVDGMAELRFHFDH